ncbi:ATP-binding cassette domain-containing protein [Algiphilus sp.]|uniref:ATP-binding cassette domain-containing protein n=3 Tax=Algiphilus sp. TaxID=1872431 RepID=UPI0025C072DE|nr:ATP-binding cassette domain-containing protein [Algiphilus sp.]MCK5771532.1 ABC-F family ATP-binding cassette domain-containing protein [Algiphilus sp.]
MPIACACSGLSAAFNDDPPLWRVDAGFDTGRTGLVGPNGCGKSVLLRLLSGDLPPASGTVLWHRPRHRVDQLRAVPDGRVADALGIGALHDCFRRIGAGAGTPADLDRVATLWHLPAEWQRQLAGAGIPLDPDTPTDTLSGGQRSRLALLAAFLHRDHYLLLDEPSNHLDADGRRWLIERLRAHRGGALVASHDRALLRTLDTIAELRCDGLHVHRDGFDAYRAEREREAEALARRIADTRKQQRREQDQHQTAVERAARRRQQGERERRSGSQSKLLLDARTEKAQHSAGRRGAAHEQRAMRLGRQLREDQARQDRLRGQRLPLSAETAPGMQRLHLESVVLPHGTGAALSVTVRAGERWRIHGRNGIGKSTLLRVMAGTLQPRSGRCRRHGRGVYLDQDFGLLDPGQSALTNLRRLHPGIDEQTWRTRLGSLRIEGDRALLALDALSGGERLKVALLAVTGGPEPPAILLLDEPDNHLDLDSRELLERALADYAGTIVVVSHDEDFIAGIGVDHVLAL